MKIYMSDGNTFIWQWQPKEHIVLEGYPDGVFVHYANCNTAEAPVVQSRRVGDKLIADIPPELMQEPHDITVYVCDADGTLHSYFIPVVERPKPESYIYEPVEILRYESLAKRIAALEEGGVGGVALDTTLTQSGKAADAKATGDEIKRVEGLIPSIDGLAKTEDIPTKPEDIGAQPKGDYLTKAPVESVNGKTGAVKLSASDVGALPNTYTPPDQTAEQVGADPAGTALTVVGEHNVDPDSHNDIRGALKALSDRLTAFFDSDDQTLDELSEIVAYIKSNKRLIDAITTSKVSVSDIVDNLATNVAGKPLSAAQGVALKALIDGLSSGKLDADRLPDAVSAALAQAKESGEFDGPPGLQGPPGPQGDPGPAGAPGAPGDDYVLTDADRQEIAEIAADIVQASDREELPITDMAGYKIAPTGTVLTGDAATQLVSAPIPINGGDTLLVTGSAKFGNSLWAIYDAAGGMLRNEAAPATAEGAAVEAVEVVVPVGAATIRVAWDKGVSTIPYAVARSDGQGQSGAALPLAGVTVAILGDSIVEHNATADTNWVDIVAAATGASITNLGVGGTGWMQGQEDGTAYYQRVADIPADTRRVLIYGSGNDRELPLGTPADTGTDTLCGCINDTLDAVYAHVPTAWVGVISPAPWQHYPPYERGNAMELMAQTQAAICRRRGVPFLDLYHSSGLRPWDAAFRELAYHDADGVHPNNTGHGLIAPQMLAFLLGGTHNPVDAQEIAELAAGLVEVPGGGGTEATKWSEEKIFTLEEDAAIVDIDLGGEYDEVIFVVVYYKAPSATAGATAYIGVGLEDGKIVDIMAGKTESGDGLKWDFHRLHCCKQGNGRMLTATTQSSMTPNSVYHSSGTYPYRDYRIVLSGSSAKITSIIMRTWTDGALFGAGTKVFYIMR